MPRLDMLIGEARELGAAMAHVGRYDDRQALMGDRALLIATGEFMLQNCVRGEERARIENILDIAHDGLCSLRKQTEDGGLQSCVELFAREAARLLAIVALLPLESI